MALDASVGTDTANSYVLLEEAELYFADRAQSDAWDTSTEKDNLLITATSVINWYSTWKGTRASGTQALDWPRVGVLDKVGIEFANTVIPTDVKLAVYEYALSSVDSDRTLDGDLAGLAQVQAGSLMIKTDNGLYSTKADTLPDNVSRILAWLTTRSGAGVVRLIRA